METFAALCCCYDGIWRVEVGETLLQNPNRIHIKVKKIP
jgi:hypothetical protein